MQGLRACKKTFREVRESSGSLRELSKLLQEALKIAVEEFFIFFIVTYIFNRLWSLKGLG